MEKAHAIRALWVDCDWVRNSRRRESAWVTPGEVIASWSRLVNLGSGRIRHAPVRIPLRTPSNDFAAD